ncbi:recombination-associated protein RdgC [Algiphilus sp. W345]|uniref:Recombination-associated protein RdgC n=1 Tax=Banduia mediterranea TaxID=3075609 RepID=A0ABU2WEG5_9GAMM|nr:recombination-associated protein RdgC [Algiphilus sp. W345]MDT0496241.1 recombination-associated protein RdgC [Algiphilus sp. W345]
MWFKNLTLFDLEDEWTLPPAQLEERLAKHPLQPCAAMALESLGWLSPRDNGALVEHQEKHFLITLGHEQKLLPSSVINDVAKEKAEEFEAARGFKPGRKQMRDFKERATVELLPRAFARRRKVHAWVDTGNKRIVVDASSLARAEIVIEQLRDALGHLAVVPPYVDPSPRSTLTQWLEAGRAPQPFALGDECELTTTDNEKSVVRYLRHSLDSEQIQRHLKEGMSVSRLGLQWRDRLSLVVDEKLQLKRVAFLEVDETAEADNELDADQQFEADFAVMTGELSQLLNDLFVAFGGSK